MRRLAGVLLCLWGLTGAALAQTIPTYWYWQVADSSPSTSVWEATSGTLVSNTSSNFTTWLTAVAAQPGVSGQGLAYTICNVTNNGSGLVRVTLCSPPSSGLTWSTGQFKTVTGVSGATGANGARTITVIDAANGIIDLQGTAFGGTYTSGGVIGSGSAMDTAANMYAVINQFNVTKWNQGGASYSISTITSTQTLSNPVSGINVVQMGSGAQVVSMPQANLFGSIPIGAPILFGGNVLSAAWTLKDSAGNTLATVPANYSVLLYLIGNSSVQGGYTVTLLPTTQLACGNLTDATASCLAASGQLPGTSTNDNASAGHVGEYVNSSCPSAATTATVTITIAAPGVITWSSHGFTSACPVVFTTTGSLPTGIVSGTTYWVVPSTITTNTFDIATSVANALAGTTITTSGSQSGTQTGTAGAPLGSATPSNVTGVALTAGDWECRASLARNVTASTSFTILKTSINTTSATDGTLAAGTMDEWSTAANVVGHDTNRILGPVRVSLSGAANVYLVADDTFSASTNIGYGFLACRRAR